MKTKKYCILASLVGCCAAALYAAGSGIGSVDQLQVNLFGASTLRGAKAVYPQVIMTQTEKRPRQSRSRSKIGPLSRDDLQAQVEKALRKSGIRIAEKYETTAPDAPLSLGVAVTIVTADESNSPPYAALVSTEAHQPVQLLRDNRIRTLTRTWPIVHNVGATQRLLVLDPQTMDRLIKDEVARQVGAFVNNYRAANPQEKRPDSEEKQMVTGTVQYIGLEGGFYGLVADTGEKYDPINLPKKYKKNGLRVKFQVREKKGMMGFHMWGKIVEVVNIEQL